MKGQLSDPLAEVVAVENEESSSLETKAATSDNAGDFSGSLKISDLEIKAVPAGDAHHAVPGTFVACLHCGGLFNEAELLPYGKHGICIGCKDDFYQNVWEGTPLGHDQTWKNGKRVVTLPNPEHTCELPNRCIHCNERAFIRHERKFDFYKPSSQLICLAVFFTTVVLVIVPVLLLRKPLTVHYSYCEYHHRRSKLMKRICDVLKWLGFGLLLTGAVIGSGYVILVSVIALVVAGVAYHLVHPNLRVRRCDDFSTEIEGVGKPFLKSLLDWKL